MKRPRFDRKAKEDVERKDREREAAEEVEGKAEDDSHRLAVGWSPRARQNRCLRSKRMSPT